MEKWRKRSNNTILNHGPSMVLFFSLPGNGKNRQNNFYYLQKKTPNIILWSKYLFENKIWDIPKVRELCIK